MQPLRLQRARELLLSLRLAVEQEEAAATCPGDLAAQDAGDASASSYQLSIAASVTPLASSRFVLPGCIRFGLGSGTSEAPLASQLRSQHLAPDIPGSRGT